MNKVPNPPEGMELQETRKLKAVDEARYQIRRNLLRAHEQLCSKGANPQSLIKLSEYLLALSEGCDDYTLTIWTRIKEA